MKIDVVHHQADDKQTITELLLLLREAELTLAQCQRQFTDSSKFDRIANRCSDVRGKIERVTTDILMKESEQSASPNEKHLIESLHHVLSIMENTNFRVNANPSRK